MVSSIKIWYDRSFPSRSGSRKRIEEKYCSRRIYRQGQRQADSEFQLFRLVMKDPGARQRTDGSHQKSGEQQRFFGDAPFSVLRFIFVNSIMRR